jgi:proliferating cell nuclear antigen
MGGRCMSEKTEVVEKPVSGEEKVERWPALVGLWEPKLLAVIVDSVVAIADDGIIKLSPNEGLSISILEVAKIAAIEVNIPKETFNPFKVEAESSYPVDFKALSSVISRIKGDASVELEFNENNLTVKSVGAYEKVYKVPLLKETSTGTFNKPDLEFKAGIKLATVVPDGNKIKRDESFAEVVRDLLSVGASKVRVSIDTENAKFTAEGEKGTVEAEFTRFDPVVEDIICEEPSTSVYSLSYLSRMLEPIRMANSLMMEIATDKPMKLTYTIGAGNVISYYLAHEIVE